MPEMQLLDYIIVAYIVFSLKNKLPNLFPGWINCFTFPPAMYTRSSFSAPLSAFKSECSSIPFGFISLMSNYVEHSVMCFLVICVIHLSEMSLYFHLTTESRSAYHSIMLTLCDLSAVALMAPLSMRFPRQEYWRGLPFPSPGDLDPKPGTKPVSPTFFTTRATTEVHLTIAHCQLSMDCLLVRMLICS